MKQLHGSRIKLNIRMANRSNHLGRTILRIQDVNLMHTTAQPGNPTQRHQRQKRNNPNKLRGCQADH
ncbi:MAG: hypothetical protein JST12_18045 [Armatimonadetes bacterium]|nr:hypothetical protein [Armatimonadota bacterium]